MSARPGSSRMGNTGTPTRPPPPIVGKVTHHSVELYWNEALERANVGQERGDSRIRITVQEEDRHGSWGNVYTGYAGSHIIEGLDPYTEYHYRVRFMNIEGPSEWSPTTSVSSTREPKTGVHVHKAIFMQDIHELQNILEGSRGGSSEINADVPDKYGFTPLMNACSKGYVEGMIEILVNYGGDVNFQNDSGKTSLMMAAYAGQMNSVKELRHFGAKYDLVDKGGSTALHWACDGSGPELIDYMIDDGADVHKADYNGWTPLLRIASVTGKADNARVLLRNKAEINLRDKDGKTTLMIAVVNGHKDLVELLLENKADLSIKNEFGKTAIEMAVSMEKRHISAAIDEYMKKNGLKKW